MGETQQESTPALVNLTELAELLDISLPTARKLVKEPGFPIEQAGTNGVPYEFDALKVADWKTANERRLEEERAARAAQVKQLKLDLFGGMSVAPEQLDLSPRDRAAALQAELDATRLAQLRGDLTSFDEAKQAVASILTVLRQELLDVGNQVARRLALPREVRAAIDETIENALASAARKLQDMSPHADTRAAA